MPPALALAGGSIAGSLISADAAGDASDAQVQASRDASNLVRQNYLDTKETLDPYAQSGIPALSRRNILLGLSGTPQQRQSEWDSVYDDPVLTQQNQLVTDAVNRSASAGGMRNSGNRLAALNDRLQRLQYEFGQNYLNRLDTSVNTGYGAAAATGGVAANAATTQASLIRSGGDAAAQGKLGQASAFQSGLSDLGAIYVNRGNFGNLYGG